MSCQFSCRTDSGSFLQQGRVLGGFKRSMSLAVGDGRRGHGERVFEKVLKQGGWAFWGENYRSKNMAERKGEIGSKNKMWTRTAGTLIGDNCSIKVADSQCLKPARVPDQLYPPILSLIPGVSYSTLAENT